MASSFLFQVLTDTDHCYCVLLNAVGGAAFPTEKSSHDSSSSESLAPEHNADSGQTNKTKVHSFVLMRISIINNI